MSVKKRRSFSKEFKTKVALAAIREQAPLSVLASKFDIHPNQISQWKREAIERMPESFERGGKEQRKPEAACEEKLFEQIGRLKVEVDYLRKNIERFS
jgi:transposase